MRSLIALSCLLKPDLGKIWEKIRDHGVKPLEDMVLGANAPRKFQVINPELGLQTLRHTP